MIELKFCEVHTPLFLAGTNLGIKLDPTRRGGIALKYNEDMRRLEVTYNGETGWVPETNVAIMVPGKPKAKVELKSHDMIAGISTSAQVETPYGHVHAGPGKGKK